MRVIRVDPRTAEEWTQLLAIHDSTVFHSPAWLDVLAETYGFQPAANIVVDDTGALLAGMVFARVQDFNGSRLVSLPFSDFCDPLVSRPEEWGLLAGALIQNGETVALRCVHNVLPLSDPRFVESGRARWHGLDITRDLDRIWSDFSPKARNKVRQALASGLTVRRSTALADVRSFFEMHLKVRKNKYRLLAQPYRFFESIWEHFLQKDAGVLLLAELNGVPIGGSVFLEWDGVLYYKFNASSATSLEGRPNDLLVWEGARYGKDHGLALLDFGLTSWEQESLSRFKRKFGPAEKKISMLRHATTTLETERSAPPMADVLPRLTELLTDERVPDDVTEEAGGLLYRFFVPPA